MVQDFGEMDATAPNNGGQILDGSLEGVVVLRHDSIVVSHTILSRGNAIENEQAGGQHLPRWILIEPPPPFADLPFLAPLRRGFLLPMKNFKKSLARCRMRYYIVDAPAPRSPP